MSRQILDTYKDADGLPVTATFAAYMIEGGFRTYREAQDSGGYLDFMRTRWSEFAAKIGSKALVPVMEERARFIDWLDARAVDQIARQAVEAA
jgi:hypothetical protein